MAVTNYYSINGQIIGESTNGVRTDYLTDALGSVTGTVNQSGVVINTYRYKPYGDLLSKTGTGADPAFGWVGTQGYKQTQKKFSNFYVRARHYGSAQGKWTTKDPIGLDGGDWNLFRYVINSPILSTDSSGLQPINYPRGCNPCTLPKSTPNYECYLNVCKQYTNKCDAIDKTADDLCSPTKTYGDITTCGVVNSCLPETRSFLPGYQPSCDIQIDPYQWYAPSTWGAAGGGRSPYKPWAPWFSYCCQECSVRVCTWYSIPNKVALEQWIANAFRTCSHGRLPVRPLPNMEFPDDFLRCFSAGSGGLVTAPYYGEGGTRMFQ